MTSTTEGDNHLMNEIAGERVLGYQVQGRVPVFGPDGVQQVVLCKSGDTWMVAVIRDGRVVGDPLYSLSLNDVLAGFTVRCGTPFESIYPHAAPLPLTAVAIDVPVVRRVRPKVLWCVDCNRWTRPATEADGCPSCGEGYRCQECGYDLDGYGVCQRLAVTGEGHARRCSYCDGTYPCDHHPKG